MPKLSSIANKVKTSLSIDSEKLEQAKRKGIIISHLLDEALTRVLEPDAQAHYNEAVANQKHSYDEYIKKTNQQKDFDDFKYENAMVEKKPKQENRPIAGSFENI